MSSFLEGLAIDVLKKYSEKMNRICVIFPSRRACHYFAKQLSTELKTPLWSPKLFSIEDFISSLSVLKPIDKLSLLFELYHIYLSVKKSKGREMENILDNKLSYFNDENFDDFFPWGEMLLRDFDIIDKYNVSADLLFGKIRDFKEIDDAFSVELKKDLYRFWKSVFKESEDSSETLNGIKGNFVKIWEILGEVYEKFTSSLRSRSVGYEGMLYRDALNLILNGKLNIKYDKVIFAGFNSLNVCEKEIFKILLENNKAEIHWDVDSYYTDDPKQEAGFDYRKNLAFFKSLQSSVPVRSGLCKEKKNITLVGSPLQVGIAKSTARLLNDVIKSEDYKPEKTAIVVPDGNILLPLLYSLPPEINDINVTMGFPFSNTPLFNFISLLKSLQKNAKNGVFYQKDIIKILLHPYIKFRDVSQAYNLVRKIRKNNYVYLNPFTLILNEDVPPLFEKIFAQVKGIQDLILYIKEVMTEIINNMETDLPDYSAYNKFQLEYLYYFFKNFNLLNNAIEKYAPEMSMEMYWNILISALKNDSIPFTGEPLKGIQIMGLLETRCLDFDTVFILSANEGKIPPSTIHNSFIPYALRKAFRVPTYEDDDSINAYYFYRLLQGAKNIYILYDTELGNNTKEKSRYILQIENELVKHNPAINLKNIILSLNVKFCGKKEVVVEKKGEVLNALFKIESLSASSINMYINCSLQFYFAKILKLSEEKDVEEVLSPAAFGRVLHRILEKLYLPYTGRTLEKSDFSNLQNDLKVNFKEYYISVLKEIGFEGISESSKGRNILLSKVIMKLIEKVIDCDYSRAPFELVELEHEYKIPVKIDASGDLREIILSGRIDRLDKISGGIELIDYKTGNVKIKDYENSGLENSFEEIFSAPDFKESVQGFLYAYFYLKENPEQKIKIGIYALK
ncbi:PD-(D/E)XK nuclease family protein [bacterium]|nr:MAG: PD-(D/E)XK nuclease family protein [bacterium]